MGLAFDKMLNKPPFGPECDPECPEDPRGSICYKGKCHFDCPLGSKKVQGKCKCEKSFSYRNPDKKIKDSWGHCVMDSGQRSSPPKRLTEQDIKDKGFVFPEGYNESYKQRVIMAVTYNPTMSKEDFEKTIQQVKESSERVVQKGCPEDYKVLQTVESLNNGQWPETPTNVPWDPNKPWVMKNNLVDCRGIKQFTTTIKENNIPKYSDNYDTVVEECNDQCKKKVKRSISKKADERFPTGFNSEENEKVVDCFDECNRDCGYDIDVNSLGECSKNCNDGSGPGKRTAKITIYKSALGSGSCPIPNAEEGKTYDIEMECNNYDCPQCEVLMKKPYYDDSEDYRGFTKFGTIYQKCLLDGKEIDCGGAEGGVNYKKGARTKYAIDYKEKSNSKGKLCVPGPPTIEEPCKPFAEDPVGNKVTKSDIGQEIYKGELTRDPDTKFVMGGGKKCNDTCIYSHDYPKVVEKCNATCDGGIEKRQKIVIADSSAPSCPEPEKKDFVCGDAPCNAPCVLQGNGEYYQINEACPGVYGGPYADVTWDSQNKKWSDNKEHKRKLKQAVLVPAIGTGSCEIKEKEEQCPTENIVQPINCEFGEWKLDRIEGLGTTVSEVMYPHLSHPRYGKHCVKMDAMGQGGTSPQKVFKREIKQKAQYGGKACVGPMEKKEPYLKGPNGTYEENACPQDQQFVPGSWSAIDWNNMNCKDKYTEKEIKEEGERKFEINDKWPSMSQVKGPGNKVFYEFKARTPVQDTFLKGAYGGFESGDWYALPDRTIPEEKYPPLTDYRLKKYRLCKNLSDINYPNPGWELHKNVVKKDCNPVYRKEDKVYRNKKVIFSNNTNDSIMIPKAEGEFKYQTAENTPKFPHNYLSRGNFIASEHKGEPSDFEPTLGGEKYWSCPGSKHWLQFETVGGNIEMIAGIVYSVSGRDKGFRVQYSRNKSSWSDNIQVFDKTMDNLPNGQKLKVFGEPVEARYIRIYPKGSMKMQAGYLKKNDGVVDCKKGYSGRKTVWSKLVFDEALTRKHGNWHEGDANKKCPKDGTRFAVCLGDDEDCKEELKPGDFFGKKYSSDNKTTGVLDNTNFSIPKDCGKDCLYGGWYSSKSEASANKWGPCTDGYEYQYKFVREEPTTLSSTSKPGLKCFADFKTKVEDDFKSLEAERSHRIRNICK
jgi:hypothetical protein